MYALVETLKQGRIWALNIGEWQTNISSGAWAYFTNQLSETSVAFRYMIVQMKAHMVYRRGRIATSRRLSGADAGREAAKLAFASYPLARNDFRGVNGKLSGATRATESRRYARASWLVNSDECTHFAFQTKGITGTILINPRLWK